MDLSIVIPVYNEGEHIKRVIQGIESVVKIPHEVFLVYDFPEDSTVPPAKNLAKQFPAVKLIRNKYGKGALKAIKTGMEEAKGKAVLVTMADCSDDPETISLMLKKFHEGFDIVCGSRYVAGGKKIGGPPVKSFLSWFSGISAKYLMGIPTCDLTNSFKLYRRALLEKIKIESQGGFELGMEILLKGYFQKGAKVSEVPTTWYDREMGKSRFHLFSWLPRYIHWYLWGLKKRYLT